MTSLEKIEKFRKHTYEILGNAKDGLFDLMDAVLTTRNINSLVELSLSPVFRRAWPSISEALQDGDPPRQKLMEEYASHIPEAGVVVLAGDHTALVTPLCRNTARTHL
jgi:hypothetical protein